MEIKSGERMHGSNLEIYNFIYFTYPAILSVLIYIGYVL